MNGYDRRAAVLLEEMRIGPLWTPRAVAQGGQDAAPETPVHAGPPTASAPGQEVQVAQARPEGQAQGTQSGAHATARSSVELAAPSAAEGLAPSGPAPASVPPVDSAWDDHDASVMPAARGPSGATPPSAPVTAALADDTLGDGAIASMDWAQLRAAIQSCRRCDACRSADARVPGQGPQRSVWMAVAGAPAPEDVAQGAPLAGEGGKLLGNMLDAIGLDLASVYVTQAIKCRPSGPEGAARAPRPEQIAACRPYLQRELELTGARTVLALGQIAANTLLERPLQEPLASARGRTHVSGEAAVVATLHPRELLVRGQDKALAWADLCLAARTHGRGD